MVMSVTVEMASMVLSITRAIYCVLTQTSAHQVNIVARRLKSVSTHLAVLLARIETNVLLIHLIRVRIIHTVLMSALISGHRGDTSVIVTMVIKGYKPKRANLNVLTLTNVQVECTRVLTIASASTLIDVKTIEVINVTVRTATTAFSHQEHSSALILTSVQTTPTIVTMRALIQLAHMSVR